MSLFFDTPIYVPEPLFRIILEITEGNYSGILSDFKELPFICVELNHNDLTLLIDIHSIYFIHVENIQHISAKVKFHYTSQYKRVCDQNYRHIVTLLAENGCGYGFEGVTEM